MWNESVERSEVSLGGQVCGRRCFQQYPESEPPLHLPSMWCSGPTTPWIVNACCCGLSSPLTIWNRAGGTAVKTAYSR